jgi:hypothetical protein
VVLGVGGLLLHRRPGAQGALEAAGGAALVAAAVPRLGVLSHSVLVTDAPTWLDRLSVSLALGVGVAAVVVGVRRVLATGQAPADRLAPAQMGGYQPPGTSASASGGPQDPRS